MVEDSIELLREQPKAQDKSEITSQYGSNLQINFEHDDHSSHSQGFDIMKRVVNYVQRTNLTERPLMLMKQLTGSGVVPDCLGIHENLSISGLNKYLCYEFYERDRYEPNPKKRQELLVIKAAEQGLNLSNRKLFVKLQRGCFMEARNTRIAMLMLNKHIVINSAKHELLTISLTENYCAEYARLLSALYKIIVQTLLRTFSTK
ncbi:hypothetical protein EDC96DRAFT_540732 [Choanephora cucurbitarum]|nr:hypothetical protein EDC96DRAFT_540732 [Choanephora cucurbitarum]